MDSDYNPDVNDVDFYRRRYSDKNYDVAAVVSAFACQRKAFSACGVSLSFIHLIFSLFFSSAASGEQYKRW